MLFQLDPHDPAPIFEQLAHQVKLAVARGDLQGGDKLPSVRELARQVGVNPNTVIRAFDELAHGGVIVRRQGSGCFISERESSLSESERHRQLDELVERAVTEAHHLGFRPADIRRALEATLKDFRKGRSRKSKS